MKCRIHRLLLATSLVYATRSFYSAPAVSEDISSAVLLEVRRINVDYLILFERQLRFEFELNLSSGHVSRLHKRRVNDLKLMAIWGCLKSVAQYC